MTIARVWRGVTPVAKAAQYVDYLHATGIKAYRATAGNKGVLLLHRPIDDAQEEFLVISLWESMSAIQNFAGDDVERAVYYPEDDQFLLEFEPAVRHYTVES